MMSIRSFGLLTAVGVLVTSCDGPTEPTPVASLEVTAPATTLASGGSVQLTAVARSSGGQTLAGRTITWSSSNQAVATVSAAGLVTAGHVLGATAEAVTITVRAEGAANAVAMSVTPVPVATVTVLPDTASLLVGATQQLITTVKDALGNRLTGRTVSWRSADTLIASVSATGLAAATPYAGGASRLVTITATSESKDGSAVLEVQPLAIASVKIAVDTIVLEAGASQGINVTVKSAADDILTNRALTWRVLDSTVVTVQSTNEVSARPYTGFAFKASSVIVSAGGFSDTLVVRVRPSEVFDGYRVAPNARALGTDYWENTTVPLDLVLRVFLTRHKNHPNSQHSGWAFAATAGDFNDDGFVDAFTAGSACQGMQSRPTFFIWNRDSLRFDERNLFRNATDYLGGPIGIEAVYLNGDNKVDLVIHGHADECAGVVDTADVILAMSAPDGLYDLIYLNLTPPSVGQTGGEEGDVADVTGDGLPDLYITNNSHSYIFRGIPGAPYFTASNPIHFASDTTNYPGANNGFGERVPTASEFAFGGATRFDVDADGRRDLIVQTTEDPTAQRSTRIFFNQGSGRFNTTRYASLPYFYLETVSSSGGGKIAHNMDVIVTDFDNDGRRDIISTNQESYQNWNIVLYIQQADGSFRIDREAVSYLGTPAAREQYKVGLVYADYNADGLLDVGYASGGVSCNNFPTTVFIKQGSRLVERQLAHVHPYAKHLSDLVRYSPC